MTEKRMTLGAVTKGRIDRPIRSLLYGQRGVGKTSWAGGAPDTIVIPTEDGSEEIESISRLPVARSYGDMIDALDLLAKEKHSYRTVAIDTLDELETHVHAQTCATKPMKGGGRASSIEDYGYGDGPKFALGPWREILVRLDRLRDRGMHIILIAHAFVKEFKNPEGDNYERYEVKVDKHASALVQNWADVVLYATHEVVTHKAEAKAKAKGISTGNRIVHTVQSAAFDAKNRYSLPATLPLSWAAFVEAVADGRAMPLVSINEAIDEELRSLDAATVERVNAARKEAGEDAVRLGHVLGRVRATKAKKEAA